MTRTYDYLREGAAIYRASFAQIRAEADLVRFDADEEKIAVRLIHACGMVEIAADIDFSPGMVTLARRALQQGAPILCDTKMVASGVTRSRLPAANDVICSLDDPRVADLARAQGTTRTAAAVELWRDRVSDAIVVIGNAPTALFRLLELIDAGMPPPVAVIGMPVGFVGASESKEALREFGRLPFAIARGRKGGGALATAAINALACEEEIL